MTREEAMRIAQGLITDFKCESETMVEFCNWRSLHGKRYLPTDKDRPPFSANHGSS